jgi:integrase
VVHDRQDRVPDRDRGLILPAARGQAAELRAQVGPLRPPRRLRRLDQRAARLHQRGEQLGGADPLFATIHERPLSYWGLKETLRRLSRKLGHPVHAHLLRHTGAVRLLVNGMPQITLQQVLGHTTLETTRRYVKLSEEETLTAHRSYAVMDNLAPRGGGE